jgi:hypothetical protein
MARHARKALIDGLERAVELRASHDVKQVRVPGGHFHAENGEVFAPAADVSGVERGGGLGQGVMGIERQEAGRHNSRVCRESEEAHKNLRAMKLLDASDGVIDPKVGT